jgi:hypothetical protein
MASPAEFEAALAALESELADVAKWSSAPHLLRARETAERGRLEIDYQSLSGKMHDLSNTLSGAERVNFDACMKEVTAAFGGMIIHAQFNYDNQLDVWRGWQEIWGQLDDAFKGIIQYLQILSTAREIPGRPRGPGGQRMDLFYDEGGCA